MEAIAAVIAAAAVVVVAEEEVVEIPWVEAGFMDMVMTDHRRRPSQCLGLLGEHTCRLTGV